MWWFFGGIFGLIVVILWIVALVDIVRRRHERSGGTTAAWIIIVLIFPIIGMIAYFLVNGTGGGSIEGGSADPDRTPGRGFLAARRMKAALVTAPFPVASAWGQIPKVSVPAF